MGWRGLQCRTPVHFPKALVFRVQGQFVNHRSSFILHYLPTSHRLPFPLRSPQESRVWLYVPVFSQENIIPSSACSSRRVQTWNPKKMGLFCVFFVWHQPPQRRLTNLHPVPVKEWWFCSPPGFLCSSEPETCVNPKLNPVFRAFFWYPLLIIQPRLRLLLSFPQVSNLRAETQGGLEFSDG